MLVLRPKTRESPKNMVPRFLVFMCLWAPTRLELFSKRLLCTAELSSCEGPHIWGHKDHLNVGI